MLDAEAGPVHYQQFFSQVRGQWILMELGTIAAALLALYFFPFPFLIAPLALSFWFFCLDSAPLILGRDLTGNSQLWISLAVGITLLLFSYLMDHYKQQDFAFWGYLFGLFAFWLSLTFLIENQEWDKFFYFIINLGLIGLALFLRRKIFLIFGGFGVAIYIGYLAYDVFANSILFPFVLSFLGLAVIYFGIFYQQKLNPK